MSKKAKFLEELKKWVGAAYIFEGCQKPNRTNCSLFILEEVLQSLGVKETPQLHSCKSVQHFRLLRSNPVAIIDGLSSFCKRVPFEKIETGDLVVLKFGQVPAQVAVYCGDGQFIYCTKSTGVAFRAMSANMRSRIVGVWRPTIYEEDVE